MLFVFISVIILSVIMVISSLVVIGRSSLLPFEAGDVLGLHFIMFASVYLVALNYYFATDLVTDISVTFQST